MSNWSAPFERQMRADLDRVERQILIRWCVMLAVGFGALIAALLAAAWLSEDPACSVQRCPCPGSMRAGS
jgi:hypothetical protein